MRQIQNGRSRVTSTKSGADSSKNPRPVYAHHAQVSIPSTAQVARAVAALLAVTLADLAEERERTGGDPLPLACLATEAVALADAVRVLTEGRAA